MSTKTTFKRIALVAVASLGFGVLSTAPSFAAAGDITMTYDFTATGSTAIPTVGSAVVIPITLATSSVTTDATGATATLTATSAMRLKVVFVDICFLSISRVREFPNLGFG